MDLDKERERCLRKTVMGKADLTCGNHFHLLPINQSNEKSKWILKKTFHPHLPSSLPWHQSPFYLPSHSQQHRGTGNGACEQFITYCVCHSFLLSRRVPQTLSLVHYGINPLGDSPSWTSPAQVLPIVSICPLTDPVWALPMGCGPSGTDFSSPVSALHVSC